MILIWISRCDLHLLFYFLELAWVVYNITYHMLEGICRKALYSGSVNESIIVITLHYKTWNLLYYHSRDCNRHDLGHLHYEAVHCKMYGSWGRPLSFRFHPLRV